MTQKNVFAGLILIVIIVGASGYLIMHPMKIESQDSTPEKEAEV